MRPALERTLRYARAAWVDLRLFLTGKSDPDLPPLRLRFVGAGDFRAVGEHLLALTTTRGRLTPSSRILDIGCGSGRLALPLTRFLHGGSYEGFDVVRPAIRWCRRNITRRYANFNFRHVLLHNADYSARGGSAAEFVFPYEDDAFDCVVAFSVFTHLQLDEMRNYLRQSFRVLRPGGVFVGTFFILTDASRKAQETHPSILQFPHPVGPLRLASRANPALAVAIEQGALEELLEEAGFRRIEVEQGGWYGIAGAAEFQDLVVCEK